MTTFPPLSRRRFLSTTASALAATIHGARTAPPSRAADAHGKQAPIIDCHLHINHYRRSIADTIRHMDHTKTDKAFILPLETGEGGVLLTSDTVLEAYRMHPDRIIPFCQCDVRQDNVLQRIHAYHEQGCRGIGEQKEPLPLADRRIERVIALCNELEWPITIHFQDGPRGFNQGLADDLESYLKRYRRVRIIGHAQTWWANISAEVPPPEKTLYPKGPVEPGGLLDRLLGDYPHLYADLSAGSGYNALSRDEEFAAGFIERHRRQLLFGSDCPCWDGEGGHFRGVCYSVRLQKFLRGIIPDKDMLADVLHGNALRVLGSQA